MDSIYDLQYYYSSDESIYAQASYSCVLKDGGILIVHSTKDSINHIIHKDGKQRAFRTNIGRTLFALITLCRQNGCGMHWNCRLSYWNLCSVKIKY